MTEYEVVAKVINACAGASRPETSFEEVEIASPEAYLKAKHPVDWAAFRKEIRGEQIVFRLEGKGVTYIYEFTEI